jgi:hypothetical protein
MKFAGTRYIRGVSVEASGELLKEGAMFNDELHKLPKGKVTRFPRGIHRYASHEEANAHWEQCQLYRIAESD